MKAITITITAKERTASSARTVEAKRLKANQSAQAKKPFVEAVEKCITADTQKKVERLYVTETNNGQVMVSVVSLVSLWPHTACRH